MNEIVLLVWFYVYAGLMFASATTSVGLFPKTHWAIQTILWPVFLAVQFVKGVF